MFLFAHNFQQSHHKHQGCTTDQSSQHSYAHSYCAHSFGGTTVIIKEHSNSHFNICSDLDIESRKNLNWIITELIFSSYSEANSVKSIITSYGSSQWSNPSHTRCITNRNCKDSFILRNLIQIACYLSKLNPRFSWTLKLNLTTTWQGVTLAP
jgi:hypothetical protein